VSAKPEASQTVPSTSISGGLSVPTGGEISGDEVMQEGDNLPIDSDPEFTPVPVSKARPRTATSDKTTRAVLRAKSKPTPQLRAVTAGSARKKSIPTLISKAGSTMALQ